MAFVKFKDAVSVAAIRRAKAAERKPAREARMKAEAFEWSQEVVRDLGGLKGGALEKAPAAYQRLGFADFDVDSVEI